MPDSDGTAGTAAIQQRPGGRDSLGGSWLVQCAVIIPVFLVALYVRSPRLFVEPRLWAEEGTAYYALLQDGAVSPFTLLVNGNYQFLTNMAAAAALWVPAVWAAHVTTAFAAAVAVVDMVLLSRVAAEEGWHPFWSALLAVALALLPQGYELYLTSTNVQWLCSISVVLLCLASLERWSHWARMLAFAWALVCGLTGVPSAALAPVVLAAGWFKRSRPHVVIGALLAFCALLQLAVIVSHELPNRHFSTSFFVLLMAAAVQSILVPLSGSLLAAPLVLDLREAPTLASILAILAVSGLLVCAAGVRLARTGGGGFVVWVLFGSAAVATVINVFGAIGAPDDLVSVNIGARYFFLGTVSGLLSLMYLMHRTGRVARCIAALALCLCVNAGVSEIGLTRWRANVNAGPSWRTVVERCRQVRPCEVRVWPGWGDWVFQLQHP